MINIRYHIVSITAVFLALGIGVALGSTFLDRATVDVLDRNIRSAENRIKETNEENDRLTKQLDDARERDDNLILTGSEDLVDGELTDTPVVVVTPPGIKSQDTDAVDLLLQRSGADTRGTMQLKDGLEFDGDVDQDLAEDLGLTDPTAAELRTEVYSRLNDAMLAAGAEGTETSGGGTSGGASPDGSTTTTTKASGGTTDPGSADLPAPDGEQPEIITILEDRGYLTVDAGPDHADDDPILETTGYRYVYVGSPQLDAQQNDTLIDLLPSTTGPAMPAVVISATQPPPVGDEIQVPTVVTRVRADEQLASRYTTVDNTETFAGLVAMIQSVRDIGTVDPGKYGQSDSATAVLPPPS